MLKHKRKLPISFATVALMCLPPAHATYPTLDSMLEAIRPDAAVIAPELNSLIIALDAIPSAQEKFDALQTLAPLADGSLRAASEGPMRQMVDVISDRVMRIAQQSGYASGDAVAEHKASTKRVPKVANRKLAEPNVEPNAQDEQKTSDSKDIVNGTWIQILGDAITQQTREQVPGYRADVYGLIIGRDRIITPQFLMGIAGGYQNADVNWRGASSTGLDIKRLHASLYGRYDFAYCPFFLQGVFTVANNQYDSNREMLIPPYGGIPYVGIAWAKFYAWEADADVQAGLVWKKNHFQAVPKLLLTYSSLHPNSYGEEDLGGLNLNVKYEDMDFLTGGAGVKFEYQNEFAEATVVPEIHGYAFYDFIADKQIATANYFGGGYAFLTQGPSPARASFEVGAGLEVHSSQHTSVVLKYDYAVREDYHRHAGFIKVRHEWG